MTKIAFLIFKPLFNYIESCFEHSYKECISEEYRKYIKYRNGYTLIEGTCPCIYSGCAICSSGFYLDQKWEQCKNGYINSYSKFKWPITNCVRCSENGCLKCNTGYFYNVNKKECEQNQTYINCYEQNCEICFSAEQGSCEKCKEGYTTKKGKCIELQK